MKGTCSQESCFLQEVGCKLGHSDLGSCPFWTAPKADHEAAASPEPDDQRANPPWTGRSLGRSDLISVATRGRPTLIGLVGPAQSGKTTFLAALYLMLLQGGRIAEYTFAGSLTLDGWEGLAGWMRWAEIGCPPTFPPHTSSAQGDHLPGILHLALRDRLGQRHDVLFTDAPGEWFSRWAVKANAQEAEGARWIVSNAAGFLLFADSENLAGSDFGTARRGLRDLMERLSPLLDGRPVGLIWSKSDIDVPAQLVESLTEAQRKFLKGAVTHRVSIRAPQTILASSSALVSAALVRPLPKPIQSPVVASDPFLAFRWQR
mgnify:FL=1